MGFEKPKRRRGKKDDGRNKNQRAGSHTKENGSADGYKPHNSLLIIGSEDNSMWYDHAKNIPGRDEQSDSQNLALAAKYRHLADEIYRSEISLTEPEGKLSSDDRWVENTMRKGTLKDRIAATSVLVSTDPVHKLSTLDSLLGMAGCTDAGQSNSRVAQMAAEALEDLFLNTLLPSDRKLLRLDQRPLDLYEGSSKNTLSPRVLLLWRFEEMLKERYQSFLNSYLVSTLREGMELSKIFALRTAGTMLKSAPEGEAQLLSMMVNKLGDPGKKIAAAAGHELRRVLEQHDNMQETVAREVLQLAHRPQLSSRALYNCIVFLNQLHLYKETENSERKDDTSPLSVMLVNMYFRMFDVAVNKRSDEKSGTKSRLLSALLTGINRAHPYLPNKDQGLEDHMDSLYDVTFTAPPSASTQALMLLFLVAVGEPTEKEVDEVTQKKQNRFYRAVYAKLSIPSFLSGGKHLTMFFNLLYKTMKRDTDSSRVLAFAKRLMCTTFHAGPPVAAASLFLLNEIMKTHRIIASCLSEIPSSVNAQLCLDPSKRDPRSAIVQEGDTKSESPEEIPPLWELGLLSNHFHPSVGKFASSLGEINYSGDPLRDFTLAPFLDKFSYKNPKTQKRNMSTVAKRRIESQLKQPVNDPAFLRQQNVDAADVFFHDFFSAKAQRDKTNGLSRKDDAEEDNFEAEDDAFVMLEGGQIENMFDDGASTDQEEEEFVDKLAMDVIRQASGQAHFDDEDPDMNDWGEVAGDIVSDANSADEDEVDLASEEDNSIPADEDAFMDESDSDDNAEAEIFLNSDSEGSSSSELGEEDAIKSESGAIKRKAEKSVFADEDDYKSMIDQGYQGKAKVTVKKDEAGKAKATQVKSRRKKRGKNN